MSVVQSHSAISPEELRRIESESGVEFAHGRIVEKPVSIESNEIAAGRVANRESQTTKDDLMKVARNRFSFGHELIRASFVIRASDGVSCAVRGPRRAASLAFQRTPRRRR